MQKLFHHLKIHPINEMKGNRYCKNEAVNAIYYSAVARQNRSRILGFQISLDHRKNKISEEA